MANSWLMQESSGFKLDLFPDLSLLLNNEITKNAPEKMAKNERRVIGWNFSTH